MPIVPKLLNFLRIVPLSIEIAKILQVSRTSLKDYVNSGVLKSLLKQKWTYSRHLNHLCSQNLRLPSVHLLSNLQITQKEYTMNCNSDCSIQPIYYRSKRYISFGIITLIALILPFIRIEGNHFFLLSFDKKQLHLLFTTFDMQELYLMPFVIMLFFLGIFFITTLGGRVLVRLVLSTNNF